MYHSSGESLEYREMFSNPTLVEAKLIGSLFRQNAHLKPVYLKMWSEILD